VFVFLFMLLNYKNKKDKKNWVFNLNMVKYFKDK